MIGAIIGDVIGSVYENQNIKSLDFPLFGRFSRFTDDTVLTVAIADAILNRKSNSTSFVENWRNSQQNKQLYAYKLKEYARRFPAAGYGQMFQEWARDESLRGYGSYSNGSAMRVCPVGYAFDNLDAVLREAKLSAVVTHNHPDGIKGAQAVASAVFLARTGQTKDAIKNFIERNFKYNLDDRLDDLRPTYTFNSACNASVPPAIIAFLESNNFEDAIRKAISLGGDSDTIACIAGGIAQAYYKAIPSHIIAETKIILDASLKRIINDFNTRFGVNVGC